MIFFAIAINVSIIELVMLRGVFMSKKEIVICSNNRGKIAEIKEYLSFLGNVDVLTKTEAGIEIDVAETGKTFK